MTDIHPDHFQYINGSALLHDSPASPQTDQLPAPSPCCPPSPALTDFSYTEEEYEAHVDSDGECVSPYVNSFLSKRRKLSPQSSDRKAPNSEDQVAICSPPIHQPSTLRVLWPPTPPRTFKDSTLSLVPGTNLAPLDTAGGHPSRRAFLESAISASPPDACYTLITCDSLCDLILCSPIHRQNIGTPDTFHTGLHPAWLVSLIGHPGFSKLLEVVARLSRGGTLSCSFRCHTGRLASVAACHLVALLLIDDGWDVQAEHYSAPNLDLGCCGLACRACVGVVPDTYMNQLSLLWGEIKLNSTRLTCTPWSRRVSL